MGQMAPSQTAAEPTREQLIPSDNTHYPRCAITAAVSGDHRNASASFCDGVIHPSVCLGLELSE